jgi:hypothetical protein
VVELPCFQGSLCSALETERSEEALVGERAGGKVVVSGRASSCAGAALTEVPASKAENTAHDGQKDLCEPISLLRTATQPDQGRSVRRARGRASRPS